jgi:tetratricopeptide (TPR) repeat protein
VSNNLQVVDADVDRFDRQDDLESRQARQLNFLSIVLRLINESSYNPDITYPLLRQHLDLLDLEIIEVLRNWVTAKFAKLRHDGILISRDDRMSIKIDIVEFGDLIQQLPLGTENINTEWSIECSTLAIKIYLFCKDSEIWGDIKTSFENDGNEFIKYNLLQSLKRAVECYRVVLEVRTQTDLPIDWVTIQNNLIVYSERSRGDSPGESLRQRAKDYYHAALEVYTPELFPYEWAKIQVNLAQFSIEQLQNYQFATEHLQSAYAQLSANNNDTGLLAQTMFELARCFHKTGSLGQARLYFKDSIRLYQRLDQPTQVAAVTSALGNLELQMGAIDDARIHLQTALEFYQAAGNLDRVASIQDLQQCLPEYSPEPVI